MPEQQITRTAIVVVDKVDKNTYGDLTFTDKAGANYKVSAKRIQYFEKIIQPNIAVELSYAMSSFGKEYIYSAKQVKDYLPPQEAKTIPDLPPPLPKEYLVREAVKAGAKVEEVHETIAPQAIGMITKEIGDMQRAGMLSKIFGVDSGIELVKWYRKQVFKITGVPFDESKLPNFKL